MSQDAIIPPAKLLEFGITFSPSTLHRREKAGTFPIRVRLGPRHHGYLESQIRAWLAVRIAEHEALQAARKAKGEAAYASV
jgi:predicted DNA-binding transcriptional regulator AlpA